LGFTTFDRRVESEQVLDIITEIVEDQEEFDSLTLRAPSEEQILAAFFAFMNRYNKQQTRSAEMILNLRTNTPSKWKCLSTSMGRTSVVSSMRVAEVVFRVSKPSD